MSDASKGRAASAKPGRRIVLHTGFPKTGTTTVQNTLYGQREKLLETYGLLYPSIAPNHTDAMCTMFLANPLQHITNRAKNLTKAQARKLKAKYKAEMEEEINAKDWRVLLISAEGLSNLSATDLSKARDWLTGFTNSISVHTYVRHPVSYSKSVIQQHLKGGETLTDMYRNPPLANFEGRLSNLEQVFGRQAMRIFAFEDAAASDEPLSQVFLRHVNPAWELLVPEGRATNTSMSHEAALILNSLNVQIPLFVDGKRNPERSHSVLAQIMRISGNRFALPPAVVDKIVNLSIPDVAALNRIAGQAIYELQAPVASDAVYEQHIDPKTVAALARILNEVTLKD